MAERRRNEWPLLGVFPLFQRIRVLAKIVGQGYSIKIFKVSGNCYEIYGTNKEGKKAEIYYDTKTLDVVKSEIEK